MEKWYGFFSAVAESSSTLTGRIFVGVSISLNRILEIPKMASRALVAIILLLTVVVSSLLFLIPDLDIFREGIIILCMAVTVWVITLVLCLRMLYITSPEFKIYVKYNIVLTQLSIWPFIVAGICMMTIGDTGIYWLISGMIFTLVKTVIDAWVLLIEINKPND
jgi:hypothetical protein